MNEIFSLTITKMVPPGQGLGFYRDKAVFVPQALAGERVEVALVKEAKKHMEARLVRVLEPSPLRIEEACPQARQCGGCSLMMLDIAEQRKLKQELLNEVLQGQGLKLDLMPLVGLEPWGYRHRAKLKFKEGQLGYFAPSSHDFVAAPHCRVVSPALAEQLAQRLDLGEVQAGEVTLLQSSQNAALAAWCPELEDGLVQDWPQQVVEDYGQGPLVLDASAFAQANPAITSAMIQLVLSWLEPGEALDELFAGVGTFTLALAAHGHQVKALESNPQAVRLGKQNAQMRELALARFAKVDVDRQAFSLHQSTALVDPPRTGLGKGVRKNLVKSPVKKLIYVSCNPATFARDAQWLQHEGSFQLKRLQGFDMFPQTSHLELVAMLERI